MLPLQNCLDVLAVQRKKLTEIKEKTLVLQEQFLNSFGTALEGDIDSMQQKISALENFYLLCLARSLDLSCITEGYFCIIPEEVILHIMLMADQHDLLKFAVINKRFFQIFSRQENEHFWQKKVHY